MNILKKSFSLLCMISALCAFSAVTAAPRGCGCSGGGGSPRPQQPAPQPRPTAKPTTAKPKATARDYRNVRSPRTSRPDPRTQTQPRAGR